MADERTELTGPELLRWVVIGLVLAAGIVFYFRLAPTTGPAVPPAAPELAP